MSLWIKFMNTFLNLTNTDYDIFGIDENKTYFLRYFHVFSIKKDVQVL